MWGFTIDSESVIRWWDKRDDPTNTFSTKPRLIVEDLVEQDIYTKNRRYELEKTINKRRAKTNPCFYSPGQARTEAKQLKQIAFFASHETRILAKIKTVEDAAQANAVKREVSVIQ